MKRFTLPFQILTGLILGAIVGFIFKEKISVIEPIGTLFLRLLKMTIIPLIFFSIAAGISGIFDLKRLRKVGVTFIKYWALASLLAATVGTIFALIVRPGIGIKLPTLEEPEVNVNLLDSLLNWVPENPIAGFAEGDFLQTIVFSLFVGVSIALLGDSKMGRQVGNLVQAGADIMGKMVSIVLKLAPFGVFALMANVTGTLGGLALVGIGKMLITQYVAYATILIVVYSLILKFLAKVNPLQHYRNIFPAMALAFSTQSSAATIPLTMDSTKRRAGVPGDIVNLITPPAATINMHAVAAEMPIYAIFAAQIYGISLSPFEFFQIIVLGVIMAAGVAGIPGGGIIMSAVLLEIMGLPMDIVAWIAGVYILIDMPNTMLNITGDTVGMVYTASKLDELDRDTFDRSNAEIEEAG